MFCLWLVKAILRKWAGSTCSYDVHQPDPWLHKGWAPSLVCVIGKPEEEHIAQFRGQLPDHKLGAEATQSNQGTDHKVNEMAENLFSSCGWPCNGIAPLDPREYAHPRRPVGESGAMAEPSKWRSHSSAKTLSTEAEVQLPSDGRAQTTAVSISSLVFESPVGLRILSCALGLLLAAVSGLSVFGVLGDDRWTNGETLQCLYLMCFGFLICVANGKADWLNKCYSLQDRLFRYFHFLGTLVGRAILYFYVGSITLLMWARTDLMKAMFPMLGCQFLLLSILTLLVKYCECCKPAPRYADADV